MKNAMFAIALTIVFMGCDTTGLKHQQDNEQKPITMAVRDLSEKNEKKPVSPAQTQPKKESQPTKETQMAEKPQPAKETQMAEESQPAEKTRPIDSAKKTIISTITGETVKKRANELYKPSGQPLLRASDIAKKLQEELSKNSNNLVAIAYDDAKGTFTMEDTIAHTAYDFQNVVHPYYGAVKTPPSTDIRYDKKDAIRKNIRLEDFVKNCEIPSFNLQVGTRNVACPSKQDMYECTLSKNADVINKKEAKDKKLKLLTGFTCYGKKKENAAAPETEANQGNTVAPIVLDYFTWKDVVNQAMEDVMAKKEECFQANASKTPSEMKKFFQELKDHDHPTCTAGDIIKNDSSTATSSSKSCKIINEYKKSYEKKDGHLKFGTSGTIEIGIADKGNINNDIKADDMQGTLTLKVLVYAIEEDAVTWKSEPREITIEGFKKTTPEQKK